MVYYDSQGMPGVAASYESSESCMPPAPMWLTSFTTSCTRQVVNEVVWADAIQAVAYVAVLTYTSSVDNYKGSGGY
jgi:hypothetical protein